MRVCPRAMINNLEFAFQQLRSKQVSKGLTIKMKQAMKRNSLTVVAGGVIALAGFIVVQAQLGAQSSPQTPNPSPELKKQDFFVGTWRLKGMTKSSPFGPGGQKFASTEHLEWMPGGFFLLAQAYSGNKLAEVTIIGYDSDQKVFTHTSFKSSGETELWRGTAEGDSWIWTKEEKIGGKPFENRLAIKKKSSNSYSFAVEMKPADGDSWSTVAEGTGTKTK
jgi:hypothetical protein